MWRISDMWRILDFLLYYKKRSNRSEEKKHFKVNFIIDSRPHIVSINWLVDGFNAKKCVPEELYYTLEPPENDHLASPDLGKMWVLCNCVW